jgi:hypothetical protein
VVSSAAGVGTCLTLALLKRETTLSPGTRDRLVTIQRAIVEQFVEQTSDGATYRSSEASRSN